MTDAATAASDVIVVGGVAFIPSPAAEMILAQRVDILRALKTLRSPDVYEAIPDAYGRSLAMLSDLPGDQPYRLLAALYQRQGHNWSAAQAPQNAALFASAKGEAAEALLVALGRELWAFFLSRTVSRRISPSASPTTGTTDPANSSATPGTTSTPSTASSASSPSTSLDDTDPSSGDQSEKSSSPGALDSAASVAA